jgi:hypothetical protein
MLVSISMQVERGRGKGGRRHHQHDDDSNQCPKSVVTFLMANTLTRVSIHVWLSVCVPSIKIHVHVRLVLALNECGKTCSRVRCIVVHQCVLCTISIAHDLHYMYIYHSHNFHSLNTLHTNDKERARPPRSPRHRASTPPPLLHTKHRRERTPPLSHARIHQHSSKASQEH